MNTTGVLRDDWDQKPGGDVSLVRYYADLIGPTTKLRGLTAARSELSVGRLPDTVLISNIDRYFEFAATASEFMGLGIPCMFAPIHHPADGILKYNRAAELGGQRLATRTVGSPVKIELVRNVLRTRRPPNLTDFATNAVKKSLGSLLQSGTIVVQAPSETEELARFLGIQTPVSHFVPNPIQILDSPRTSLRDIDVLVVGRIEPRKNQLRVARYLSEINVNVVFVGAMNAKHSSYARRFRTVIANSDHLRHVDHVSPRKLSTLYERSKVLVGISFMEVVSLAHLDAVGHGMQLLTTIHSYTEDYLGDSLHAVDPLVSKEEFIEAVGSLLGRGLNDEGWTRLKTEFPRARAQDEMKTALSRLSASR